MFGIKICGRFKSEAYPDRERCRIDYEFSDLIAPISKEIEEFTWIYIKSIFKYEASDGDIFTDFEERYGDIILKGYPEDSQDNKVAIKGFLPRYAKFVLGDWTDIFGFSGDVCYENYFDQLGNIHSIDSLKRDCQIRFRCIDGAYWEIFCKDKALIDQVARRFPFHSSAAPW